MKTFAGLVAKALEHAALAEELLDLSERAPDRSIGGKNDALDAATHAALAETYARLASAAIVNQTSTIAAMAGQMPGARA